MSALSFLHTWIINNRRKFYFIESINVPNGHVAILERTTERHCWSFDTDHSHCYLAVEPNIKHFSLNFDCETRSDIKFLESALFIRWMLWWCRVFSLKIRAGGLRVSPLFVASQKLYEVPPDLEPFSYPINSY